MPQLSPGKMGLYKKLNKPCGGARLAENFAVTGKAAHFNIRY